MFPTADQIAIAIVAAARAFGDSPLAVARGGGENKTRIVAYGALTAAFPEARKTGISRCVGFASQAIASASLITARRRRWWTEDLIDEIVGQLVAEEYESEAGPNTSGATPALRADALHRGEAPAFSVDERRLIAKMQRGGSNAATIAAALGADADQVKSFMARGGA